MARRERGHGSIYQRADGTWSGQINVAPEGAKRHRKTVYGKSRAEVVRKLAETRRAIQRGDSNTSSPRFSVWLDDWLKRAELKPRTRQSYGSIIETHLKPVLGNVRITALRATHVHMLHDSMDGRSPTTIRNVHRCASAAMQSALAQERAVLNPFATVRAPTKADGTRMAISSSGVDTLLAFIEGDRLESRWHTALYLGVRQGECLGLTWECVNFEDKTIDLAWQLQTVGYLHGCPPNDRCSAKWAPSCPQRHLDLRPGFRHRLIEGGRILQSTKTKGSTRVLPIPNVTIGPLKQLWLDYLIERERPDYHDHGLVWHRGNGRPFSARDDRERWHALLATAGIPQGDLHAARHTAATLLLEDGVDPKIIQQILGHSDIVTTQNYQHVDVSLARRAVDGLGLSHREIER